MKQFDIWQSGFTTQGCKRGVSLIAVGVEAESLSEAAKKWYETISSVCDAKRMYGELSIREGRVFLWGCELFDNYKDACCATNQPLAIKIDKMVEELRAKKYKPGVLLGYRWGLQAAFNLLAKQI